MADTVGMSMDDVTAFVKARLDEDVAALGYVEPGPWTSSGPYVGSAAGIIAQARHTETGAHIARHDPDRVLADVEADRKLLAALERARAAVPPVEDWYEVADGILVGTADALLLAVKIRAGRFADHPDYRQEWAP